MNNSKAASADMNVSLQFSIAPGKLRTRPLPSDLAELSAWIGGCLNVNTNNVCAEVADLDMHPGAGLGVLRLVLRPGEGNSLQLSNEVDVRSWIDACLNCNTNNLRVTVTAMAVAPHDSCSSPAHVQRSVGERG